MTAIRESLFMGRAKFREVLRQKIEARGVSPRQIALAADITPAFMSKLLSGKSGYSAETIEKLADAVCPDGADDATRAAMRRELLHWAFVEDEDPVEYIPTSLTITIEGYSDLTEGERHATEEAAKASAEALARAFREARRRAGTIGFGPDRYEE